MVEGLVGACVGLIVGAAAVGTWAATKLAHLKAKLEMQDLLSSEKEKTIKESVQSLLGQVTNVTNAALKEREAEFSRRNGQEMKSLMEPMRVQLETFQKAAEASRKANGELGVKMEDFFKVLQTAAGDFGKQAKSFTDALSGANKKQGNWGELILHQALLDCGLVENENFVAQRGSGEGIPDFQIFDPGSRKILIIDSKMSWTKYESSYRMEEGPERTAALKAHVQSVKGHIDELVKADYPKTQQPLRPGYTFVPLTAMFVPSDAALAAAIHEEPALVDYAFKRNVALVSPLTLFGFLQLVARAWSLYNTNKNSEEIMKQAKLVVERIDKLFKGLEEVGDSLEKARRKHEDVLKLARTEVAGQCIKGPALKILKYGGAPERGIKSATLLDATEEAEISS